MRGFLYDWEQDFWDVIDSESAYYSRPFVCGCHSSEAPQPWDKVWQDDAGDCVEHGPGWNSARRSTCIALRGDGTRCRNGGAVGDPFCSKHADRAVRWVMNRYPGLVRRWLHELEDDYLRAVINRAAVEDARLEEIPAVRSRVYFMGIDDQVVKIGRSIQPQNRLTQIRNGSSVAPVDFDVKRTELLGTTPGGATLEASLHRILRPWRLAGEWFEMSPEVTSVAAYLCLGEMKREATRVFIAAETRKWWQAMGFATQWEAEESFEFEESAA